MKKIIIVISLIISTFEINKKKDCFQLDVPGTAPLFVIKQKVSHCLGKPIDGYYKEIYTKSGGRFISRIRSDYVVALYWHKTKTHCLKLIRDNVDYLNIASPGQWTGDYAEPGNNVKVIYYELKSNVIDLTN